MKKILLSLLITLILISPVLANQLDERQIKANTFTTPADVASLIADATSSIEVNQTITVQAGENLTPGMICSIINDGGVQKAYNIPLTVSTSPNGAESVFNSAATTYCSAVALDNSRFLVAYVDSDTYVKAIVGTVTGSTIAWGSETASFQNNASTNVSACKLATDKVLVCYNITGAFSRVKILTISSSTITVNNGANDDLDGAAQSTYISCSQLDTDKAIICYRNEGDTKGKAKILTTSGTVHTQGSVAEFNAASTAYNSVSAISSTSAIVSYKDIGNGGKGTAQILSISGTTITPGTEYVFENSAIIYTSCVVVDLTKAVITYALDAGGGKTLVATNSSGELSYGTAATFTDGDYNSTAKIDSTHVIIASQVAATDYGQSIIGTINGTGITLGTPYSYNAATTVFISVCHLGNQKSVIAYNDAGNSNYGTAVVNTRGTSSYASISGISSGAYSSGSDAVVLIHGSYDGLSGLISGSPYFVAADFSLSTSSISLTNTIASNSSTTREIHFGVAKSSTEIILNIDYR